MERAEEQKERKGRGDDGEENRWSHGDHEPEDTGSHNFRLGDIRRMARVLDLSDQDIITIVRGK